MSDVRTVSMLFGWNLGTIVDSNPLTTARANEVFMKEILSTFPEEVAVCVKIDDVGVATSAATNWVRRKKFSIPKKKRSVAAISKYFLKNCQLRIS